MVKRAPKAPTRAKTADDPLPRWFDGRPLVACKGGPYPSSWEYLDRWLELRQGYNSGPSWHRLGYVPIGQKIAHPDHPGVKAALLVWDGELAVTLSEEQWLARLPADIRKAMEG